MGIIREQIRWMLDILSDPAKRGMVIVAAPHELPVNETMELAAAYGRRQPSTLPPWS